MTSYPRGFSRKQRSRQDKLHTFDLWGGFFRSHRCWNMKHEQRQLSFWVKAFEDSAIWKGGFLKKKILLLAQLEIIIFIFCRGCSTQLDNWEGTRRRSQKRVKLLSFKIEGKHHKMSSCDVRVHVTCWKRMRFPRGIPTCKSCSSPFILGNTRNVANPVHARQGLRIEKKKDCLFVPQVQDYRWISLSIWGGLTFGAVQFPPQGLEFWR